MKTHNPTITVFRYFLIVFGVLATVAFYLFQAQGITYTWLTTIFSTLALISALFALRYLLSTLGDGPKHFGFKLLFIGILSTTIGQLLWGLLTLTGRSMLANTIPSYFFYFTYLINFLAYLKLGYTSKINFIEFIGIAVGFSVLGLILFTLANASHPLTLDLMGSIFIIGDFFRMIIIAMLLQMVVIYQGGLLGRYWLSVFVGNFFIIIGNFASNILAKQYYQAIWPYTLIDLIFIGGYLFVAHGFYGFSDSINLTLKKIKEHYKNNNKLAGTIS